MNRKPWLIVLFTLLLLTVALVGAAQWTARYRFLTRGWADDFVMPVATSRPSVAAPAGGGGEQVPWLCVNAPLLVYDAGALDEALDLISAGGFTWVRVQVTPADVQPAPGRWDWTALDAVVNAADAQGLRLWVVLDGAPEGNLPPEVDPFAVFAAAVAARYGETLTTYQIWHNPNLGASWGGNANPFEYTALLAAAAEGIRAVDPDARIVLGSLAPTVEVGERNYAEDLFLEMLYAAGAGPYFDVVAVQPYGFDTGPLDRRVDRDVLNFSRAILAQELLEARGEGAKALWASDFGWNSKPPAWPGPPSIWGEVDPMTQAAYTVEALDRIAREWPWMGVACVNNFQPRSGPYSAGPETAGGVPNAETHWGFALVGPGGEIRPVYEAIQRWAGAAADSVAAPGVYRADTELATFEGPWTLGSQGADIGEHDAANPPRVRFVFEGTGVALTVRRGPYRAFLYVEVDGQPAPALPKDRDGRAYVVLYDPLAATATVPLAQGLPPGEHTVEIEAHRGWGQWALADWRVVSAPQGRASYWWGMTAFAALAVASVGGAVWAGRRGAWRRLGATLIAAWERLSEGLRVVVSLLIGAVALFAAWQTVLSDSLFRRLGERGGLAALALTTVLFYVSPWFLLTLATGLLVALIVVLQPSMGLMLTMVAAPFWALHTHPLALMGKSFSLAEIVLLPTLVGWVLSWAWLRREGARSTVAQRSDLGRVFLRPVALLVIVAIITALAAEHRRVALRELRLVVLEPALFFVALVTLPMTRRERWRIIDGWVLGSVLIASWGLVQYARGVVITAEGGIPRLISIYGSPNNVGLQMGRLVPFLIAVVLWGGRPAESGARGRFAGIARQRRRWLYLVALVPVGLALLLSLSRGALVLGVPAALVTLGLLAGPAWRRMTLAIVAVGIVLGGMAMAFPDRLGATFGAIPRFADMFDFSRGSPSFRVALWHSTLQLIRDHPVLGVGPDNFLYAYRTRYVLPTAWQEFDLSHPHNVLLDFTARLGVGGLVAFVWMQVIFWRAVVPLRRRADPMARALALGVAASMAGFLAHGVVDAAYFLIDLAFIHMVSLALVVWLDRGEMSSAPIVNG